MHGPLKDGTVYKTKNVYASDDRDVYLFLIRTMEKGQSGVTYRSCMRRLPVQP